MKKARLWFFLVGAWYILNLIGLLPPLMQSQLPNYYPGLEVASNSVAYQALVDVWFLFGLLYGTVGIGLMLAARSPAENRLLITLVVLIETIAGILWDIYSLSRAITPAMTSYFFIVVHLLIIGTAAWVYPRKTVQ
jgi:hypothetical protein